MWLRAVIKTSAFRVTSQTHFLLCIQACSLTPPLSLSFFNSSSSLNPEGLFYHVQSGPNRHDESCYASSEVFLYLLFLNSEAVRTGEKSFFLIYPPGTHSGLL